MQSKRDLANISAMNIPTQINHIETGKIVRKARQNAKIGLRRLAVALGCSAPFLYDLECGRRNWTQEKFETAMTTIKQWKTSSK